MLHSTKKPSQIGFIGRKLGKLCTIDLCERIRRKTISPTTRVSGFASRPRGANTLHPMVREEIDMGWSHGIVEGKHVGYAVRAKCEHPGCKKRIDRGLAYNPVTGNLVLVSRTGGNNVRILNGATEWEKASKRATGDHVKLTVVDRMFCSLDLVHLFLLPPEDGGYADLYLLEPIEQAA
jgi:hypothetical protein